MHRTPEGKRVRSRSKAAQPTLQETVFRILGNPWGWRADVESAKALPSPEPSTLPGHERHGIQSMLPDAHERCAGCNGHHAVTCPALSFCKPCGEAWCAACITNDDIQRGVCAGCTEVRTHAVSGNCGEECKAAESSAIRPPAHSVYIVLSWGALMVVTGKDPFDDRVGVVPDSFWGAGFLLPDQLISFRRFWGSADYDLSKRVRVRVELVGSKEPSQPPRIVLGIPGGRRVQCTDPGNVLPRLLFAVPLIASLIPPSSGCHYTVVQGYGCCGIGGSIQRGPNRGTAFLGDQHAGPSAAPGGLPHCC